MPHPKNGINSGVMLMNLEAMRSRKWNDRMLIIFEAIQPHTAFCDQDLLNVYSSLYLDELDWIPCSANYRSDFCLSNLGCQDDLETGMILHGNRAVFHGKLHLGGTLKSFFTSYVPKVLTWFFYRNIRLIEYSLIIRWECFDLTIFADDELAKIVFNHTNHFCMSYHKGLLLRFKMSSQMFGSWLIVEINTFYEVLSNKASVQY